MTPTGCPNPFVDINNNVFYYAIHYLYCRGVVNGTDATHYSPAGKKPTDEHDWRFEISPPTPAGGLD